jgi:hypothetical protein
MKTAILGMAAAAALALGAFVPAQAQEQEGLVNVNVSDIDVGVIANVQAPVGIAANVCGVAANVLAQDVGTGDATCNATAESAANSDQFMRFAERQGQAQAITDAIN